MFSTPQLTSILTQAIADEVKRKKRMLQEIKKVEDKKKEQKERIQRDEEESKSLLKPCVIFLSIY